jgi:carbohydrate-selective porin OprB
MAMMEAGITPKLGASELPGKYAMGGYYYGGQANSFFGTPQYGKYGFYWQADQMLFREPTPYVEPEPAGKGATADSKSFKAPVSYEKPKLSDQGLSMFNLVSYAPKYNNLYPFYFQSGLVYKGLIPGRDKDLTMFSVAYGSYSYYNTVNRQNNGREGQDYTMFLEGGYRFQINKWVFVQPFAQYVIRPNGTDAVQNAFILGTSLSLNF